MPGPCGLIIVDPTAAVYLLAGMGATNLFLMVFAAILVFARHH